MCSDAQIFILLGCFLSELGSRATVDSVTVPVKEGGPSKETFIRGSVVAPPGVRCVWRSRALRTDGDPGHRWVSGARGRRGYERRVSYDVTAHISDLSLKPHKQDGSVLETGRPKLHPLLRHLRKRSAGCAKAAVQNRSREGRRVQRQSPKT